MIACNHRRLQTEHLNGLQLVEFLFVSLWRGSWSVPSHYLACKILTFPYLRAVCASCNRNPPKGYYRKLPLNLIMTHENRHWVRGKVSDLCFGGAYFKFSSHTDISTSAFSGYPQLQQAVPRIFINYANLWPTRTSTNLFPQSPTCTAPPQFIDAGRVSSQ